MKAVSTIIKKGFIAEEYIFSRALNIDLCIYWALFSGNIKNKRQNNEWLEVTCSYIRKVNEGSNCITQGQPSSLFTIEPGTLEGLILSKKFDRTES